MKRPTAIALMLVALSLPAGSLAEDKDIPTGCSFESFAFGEGERAYILCVPEPVPRGALPVVMGFHGGVGVPEAWMLRFPFHELGNEAGFVTLYMAQACRSPDDIRCDRRERIGWNVGKPGAEARAQDHDYIRAVATRLSTVHGLEIDRDRIFGTGHSLGGIYIYSVACDMPGFFAAIGPISAPPTDATCEPRPGTNIYHVHGTLDPNVPFDTGCCSASQKFPGSSAYLAGCDHRPLCANPVNWWPPVRSGDHPYAQVTGLDAFAARGLNCKGDPQVSGQTEGVTCLAWECPAGRAVEACLIHRGNHRLEELDKVLNIRRHLWDRFSGRTR
ncbi:MAG: alpha/beta hydrolase family esterase [Pseudomonadota bacterium]